ncbi:MAG: hypothetical protein CO187_04305 [Zetaproteobacteria bacterium CG_4_9_14_3_um_filter_53_7]|nr:MAG: hypothetical protein CO187_04305 [Zetaproteobacteria bacterium CG_4_9_14_3_um_filter_53_7]
MSQINRMAADYTGLGSTGETVLAARHESEAVFLTPLRFDPNAALTRSAKLGSELALPMQQALQGSGDKGLSIDYRGKEVLAVWQYLPHTRLGMVVKIDSEEAFASIDRFTNILLIIALLTVIGVVVAGLVVSRSLASPIIRLTEVAEQIASGDYSGRIDIDSTDEIGALASAFNNMTDNIDRQRHQIMDKSDQIEKRSATLSAANEEIKSFAYIVSHDLRSPLVNMKGFTGELKFTLEEITEKIEALEDKLAPTEREAIHRLIAEDIPESMAFISTSVDKMDAMLTAILKLSRLGRRVLQFEQVDLTEICNNALASLAHQIETTHTTVLLENMPIIYNDRMVMEQIMGNLIGNAVKYLATDRPGRIRIYAETNNSGTVIYVEDNGRGISDDEKEKVFQIFRRGKHQDVQGEGMGLAYVQTLARAQNGSISFESEENKGSTFTVYLPNKPSAQA